MQSGHGSISVAAGGVILAVNVESLTDDDTNDITLDADGHLTISGDVNAGAAGDVNLIATGNVTGAQVTADVLNVDADGLINLNTTVASTDLWAGTSINLVETDAITLTNVQSGHGSISVDAGGVILAVNVESQTDAHANDITLDAVGNINITTAVNAGAAGDVNLIATGNVTGAQVTADVLNVDADGLINLNTTGASTDLLAGTSINLVETDAITLTNVQSGNGSISVAAGGVILAVNVESLTDDDTNDITLNAAGDLTIS
ncbi:MAG: hypothetical protein GY754_41310, partial [bacterium]|nr:hypothetical protein [bacterium]